MFTKWSLPFTCSHKCSLVLTPIFWITHGLIYMCKRILQMLSRIITNLCIKRHGKCPSDLLWLTCGWFRPFYNLSFVNAYYYAEFCDYVIGCINKETVCWVSCVGLWLVKRKNFDALCSEHCFSRCDNARPIWIKFVGHDHNFSYFIRFNHYGVSFDY